MTIMISLFGSTVVPLFRLALANFYHKILDFAKVYRWQEGVLPLALNLHTHIVKNHSSDFFQWKTPGK